MTHGALNLERVVPSDRAVRRVRVAKIVERERPPRFIVGSELVADNFRGGKVDRSRLASSDR